MKTIEIYNENLMNTFHLVVNHIVSLRQTAEGDTVISLANSESVLTKKSLADVLELIKNAK